MSETIQIEDAAGIICNLKAAVTALECQYKMNLLEEQALRKEQQTPRQSPMFVMIPLEQKRNSDDSTCEEKTRRKRKSRDSTDSRTSFNCKKPKHRRRSDCSETSGPTMRGGILHTRCGCIHRDGLQDSCPLTECQGQPECMTKPWATCPPARYFRARFPEIWPAPATDSISF